MIEEVHDNLEDSSQAKDITSICQVVGYVLSRRSKRKEDNKNNMLALCWPESKRRKASMFQLKNALDMICFLKLDTLKATTSKTRGIPS